MILAKTLSLILLIVFAAVPTLGQFGGIRQVGRDGGFGGGDGGFRGGAGGSGGDDEDDPTSDELAAG